MKNVSWLRGREDVEEILMVKNGWMVNFRLWNFGVNGLCLGNNIIDECGLRSWEFLNNLWLR